MNNSNRNYRSLQTLEVHNGYILSQNRESLRSAEQTKRVTLALAV